MTRGMLWDAYKKLQQEYKNLCAVSGVRLEQGKHQSKAVINTRQKPEKESQKPTNKNQNSGATSQLHYVS